MKKYSYIIHILLCFISLNIFSQTYNYAAALIPKELKENANAVVRDQSIEITIEDFDKMIVAKREVVTVLNKLGNVDARIVES